MSLDISVLVSGAPSTKQVLERLATEGLTFAPREPGLWTANLVGVGLALIDDPDLEDDGDLRLSHFRTQLSINRYAGTDSDQQETMIGALALLIAARLARETSWHCLVVRDLQITLAEYGRP